MECIHGSTFPTGYATRPIDITQYERAGSIAKYNEASEGLPATLAVNVSPSGDSGNTDAE